MAGSRRVQAGLAIGLVLLASTAACEQNEPIATVGEPVRETPPPVTSLVLVTAPPVTISLDHIDDCVEFVMFAAYVGVEDMVVMWDAAGKNIGRLRENCISLGKADPDALAALSERRDQLEAFFGVTTTSGAG
jgi:hypothetical protein